MKYVMRRPSLEESLQRALVYDDPTRAEPIDLPTQPATEPQELNTLYTPDSNEKARKTAEKEAPGFEVEEEKIEEKANSKTLANNNLPPTPINPREPFTRWKFPSLDLLKEYNSDTKTNYVSQEELEANKDRIIKVLNDFGVQIRSIRGDSRSDDYALRDNTCTGYQNL